MSRTEKIRKRKRFEYRYGAAVLLSVAFLLLASLFYTFRLWPVKGLLVLVLVTGSGILLRRASHL